MKVNEGTVEVRELELWVENDATLYRQQGLPIIKNLMRKRAAGQYDSRKAVKLYMYLVDSGAKSYAKEHAGAGGMPWHKMFNKPTRMEVARRLVRSFEDEADLGNYDEYIPKKYQKKESVEGRQNRFKAVLKECSNAEAVARFLIKEDLAEISGDQVVLK